MDFYESIKNGHDIKITKGNFSTNILRSKSYYATLDQWCREVVWWGNKKGAYLYRNEGSKADSMLDGHY